MEYYPCPKRKGDCPFRGKRIGCHVVSHHIFWPKSRYEAGIEEEFRELPRNRVEMCKWEEQVLHDTTEPPPKPSLEIMQHCVEAERLRRELHVDGTVPNQV